MGRKEREGNINILGKELRPRDVLVGGFALIGLGFLVESVSLVAVGAGVAVYGNHKMK
jgi:hypothetical protein